MIRFTSFQLFKNKWLWLWPLFIIGVALAIGIWGDVQAAQNGYSFIIVAGSAAIPSAKLMGLLISVILIISAIASPTHFSHNIESERASLILANPISRIDFLLSDFAGALIMALAYTLITIIVLGLLVILKAGILPVEFFLALLIFIPLHFFAYYVAIDLFLILTGSQLASILLGYFLIGFLSGLFFHADKFLAATGYGDSIWVTISHILSYIIPCTAGIQKMTQQLLTGGFASFDGGLFLLILVSFLPFGLLSLYLMNRKQF